MPVAWTQAVAECRQGHTWPCRWRLEVTERPSGITSHRRVVEPETCAECAQRWDQVRTPNPKEVPRATTTKANG